LQRQRAVLIKSRVMQSNRLVHVVAGTLGYSSGLEKEKRAAVFAKAGALIKDVLAGRADAGSMTVIIRTTHIGIDAFRSVQENVEKEMVAAAKRLPVSSWVLQAARRGFGLLGLAIVVGECGDLGSYANPGKVWRRMGCAPWSFEGKTLMGATWRSGQEGKLPSDEWTQFGYSPRRRSIAYLIGESIVKQNGAPKPRKPKAKGGDTAGEASIETDGSGAGEFQPEIESEAAGGTTTETDSRPAGPYRTRYDTVKVEAAQKHPDWKPIRVHRHAMLLATKMLLKELWVEWRKQAGTYTTDGDWEAQGAMNRVAGRYGE
jgi:hypothetical protein